MNRRQFLQVAAVLAAGATSARGWSIPYGWSMNQEQHALLAAGANYIDRTEVNFFNAVQRAAVTAMAEQVIPATDTPGASEAGVPRFIELMTADWFNNAERQVFMQGLDAVLAKANGDFAALPESTQLEILQQLEDASSDADWYQFANVMRIWDDNAPFICQFKELCVLGYFLSQVGATQALRDNPMGSFDGDIALQPQDRAYNALIPLRSMGE